MQRNFTIVGGIHLSHGLHRLDLHNQYRFTELAYSLLDRTLVLTWKQWDRGQQETEGPGMVQILFSDVQEFRFKPRRQDMPFTEDDCVSTIGYWSDEEWAGGVLMTDDHDTVDPSWLTAIQFMSGAIVIVRASFARASIHEK